MVQWRSSGVFIQRICSRRTYQGVAKRQDQGGSRHENAIRQKEHEFMGHVQHHQTLTWLRLNTKCIFTLLTHPLTLGIRSIPAHAHGQVRNGWTNASRALKRLAGSNVNALSNRSTKLVNNLESSGFILRRTFVEGINLTFNSRAALLMTSVLTVSCERGEGLWGQVWSFD